MAYTNSSLATYRKISSNKTSPRNHVIDRITVHCYVGQVTAKRGCDGFQNRLRSASCNYVVGYDGSIGLCVEEKDRSWCSSNKENDMRAVTIEVASETKDPYKVTDQALNSLINLITDICKRNGKNKIIWFGDKNKTLTYKPASNEMVMTVHRWFANKSCPGNYLYSKHPYIAEQVNKRLGFYTSTTTTTSTPSVSKGKFLFEGLDYALVFNPTYYVNRYPDIKSAIGNNSTALFNHFCTYGMKEGRVACANFDINVYKNTYADLRSTFGNNLPAYYKHYIQFGYNEKRKCV